MTAMPNPSPIRTPPGERSGRAPLKHPPSDRGYTTTRVSVEHHITGGHMRHADAWSGPAAVLVHRIRQPRSRRATADDMRALLERHATHPLALERLRDRIMPLCDADAAQQAVRSGGLSVRIVPSCDTAD